MIFPAYVGDRNKVACVDYLCVAYQVPGLFQDGRYGSIRVVILQRETHYTCISGLLHMRQRVSRPS